MSICAKIKRMVKTPTLKCPFAVQRRPQHKTVGQFTNDYPNGVVIHYTAGHTASSALQVAQAKGYAFWVLDIDGEVIQTHPLDRWGHHAGPSFWAGLNPPRSRVSKRLLGIEVVCPGRLEQNGVHSYQTWYKKEVPGNMVRISDKRHNITAGAYHKFTDAQELALEKLICWLKWNNPKTFDFKYVLGHDEVAPMRKQDPGGSLSVSMPDFREHLERVYENVSREF